MSIPDRRPRLDAFLSRGGHGTRSTVKTLIRAGRVTIAGEVCRSTKEWVAGREVCVDGELVVLPPDVLHIALHKPIGYACSHDPRETPLLFDLIPEEWQGLSLQAAGRLDRATSGLLILTTDGGFLHRLSHPNHKVPKRYRIEYEGTLASDAVERCAAGFVLLQDEDRVSTAPSRLILDAPGRATMILREGRHHQVRRMIRTLGARVTALHRDRVGAYDLPDDLAPGLCRELADRDLELLSTNISL